MKNPIVKFPNGMEFKVDDLPSVIRQSFSEIEQSENKIKRSIIAAERAKDAAKSAKEKSAGWSFTGSKKKDAIEALQDASCEISKAQESLTDAMRQFFQGQKKMAESIKKLFGLGVLNIAANRTVVRELELKLKNASEEELSELARQEMLNVVQQLKAQEDLYNRIEKQKETIKTLRSEMDTSKEECNNMLIRISELNTDVSQEMESLRNAFVEQKQEIQKQANEELSQLKAEYEQKEARIQQNYNQQLFDVKEQYQVMLSSQKEEIEHSMARLREKSFCNSNAFIILSLLISLTALIASVVL